MLSPRKEGILAGLANDQGRSPFISGEASEEWEKGWYLGWKLRRMAESTPDWAIPPEEAK